MGKTFEIDYGEPEAPRGTFEIDYGEEPSAWQRFKRGAGITTRGAIEGAASIPLAITDAPVTVKRSLGYPSGRSGQEMLSIGLDKIGLPRPETTQEHLVNFAAGAVVPTEGLVKLSEVGKVGRGFGDRHARALMQSAIKPTLEQLRSGDAAVAIDTMLRKGIPLSEKGVRRIRDEIDVLNGKIREAIKNSGETVSKSAAVKNLVELLDKFKMQVNPQADMDAVLRSWHSFRDHPLLMGKEDIPVELAQQLKQGTYNQLRGKYGEMGSADIEAQKAIARNLKDQIAEKVPGVSGFNAEEANLIRTLDVMERRVLMELNKNPAGLSLLASNPKAAFAFMADRSAAFKQLAARMIYRSGPPIAGTAKRGAAISLQELSRNAGKIPPADEEQPNPWEQFAK